MARANAGTTRPTLAALKTLSPAMLLALLAATIGTNLLDFVTVPPSGSRPGAGFVLAALVRVVAVFWISYAASRQLAGSATPFRAGPGLLRFVGLQILLLVGFGLATRIALAMTGPQPAPLATQWLFAFLAIALFSLATIRLLAWNVALALDAPFAALGGIWRGQAGSIGAITRTLVGVILPVAALHLAMTLVALRIDMGAGPKLALGVIDGAVQALQLGLSCALGVVAWRIARTVD